LGGIAKLMGGFSRKGLNYFGQSKSRRQEKTPTSYGKNRQKSFPSHSITLAYKEIKCIFVEVILNTKWFLIVPIFLFIYNLYRILNKENIFERFEEEKLLHYLLDIK
jgi:hypothetical protein